MKKYLEAYYVLDTLRKWFQSSQQLYKGTITILVLQMRKLDLNLPPSQAVSKGQKQNLSPELTDSKIYICFPLNYN